MAPPTVAVAVGIRRASWERSLSCLWTWFLQRHLPEVRTASCVNPCSTVAALPAASRSPELSGPGELELPQTPHSSSSFLLLGSHKVRSKIVWHIGLRIGSCVTLPFSVIFATPNCPSCVHCTAGSLLQSPLHNHTSPTHDGGFYCFRQDLSDLGLCCSF